MERRRNPSQVSGLPASPVRISLHFPQAIHEHCKSGFCSRWRRSAPGLFKPVPSWKFDNPPNDFLFRQAPSCAQFYLVFMHAQTPATPCRTSWMEAGIEAAQQSLRCLLSFWKRTPECREQCTNYSRPDRPYQRPLISVHTRDDARGAC